MAKYLFIGNGRLSTHLQYYFKSLGLIYSVWTRQSNEDLNLLAEAADRILLLIPDDEIENFVQTNSFLKNKKLIHCSGTSTFNFAESAHPLNTFGRQLYALEIYHQIPFVIEKGGSSFADLLPGVPNTHYELSHEKKALYHALCVMSGNFTTLLWQNTFENFEERLRLPREILQTYLTCTIQNLLTNPDEALTGPVTRGDVKTIIRNLDALTNMPEQDLYYAFLNHILHKKNIPGVVEHGHLEL